MSVSVALPTYNGQAYIKDQLDSIINQSHQPDEIVVFDDCSTDSTVDILQEYKHTYPDLFEIHTGDKNVGINDNFMRVIEETDGDYIAIADQDDVWQPEKIELQLGKMDTETTLITHNSRLLTQEGKKLDKTLWDGLIVSPSENSPFERLLVQNFAQGASIFFDAEIKPYLSSVPDGFLYDHFISLIASACGEISVIDQCLLNYRQHDDQVRGASKSLSVKIKRQLSQDVNDFSDNVDRWDALTDRFSKIDDHQLRKNFSYYTKKISARKEFDNWRHQLVSPDTRITEKIPSLLKLLSSGYSSYAHRGLAGIDLLLVIQFYTDQ